MLLVSITVFFKLFLHRQCIELSIALKVCIMTSHVLCLLNKLNNIKLISTLELGDINKNPDTELLKQKLLTEK